MLKYLLSADVARMLGLTPASVRLAAARGRLPVAAITVRGTRLYLARDVERLRQRRDAARAAGNHR